MELYNKFKTLILGIALLAVIMSCIWTLLKGKPKESVVVLFLGGIFLVFVSNPQRLINISDMVVTFVENIGGNINANS